MNLLPKNSYLDRLYVSKDYQGQGVATSLWERLETRFPVSHITAAHASLTAKPFLNPEVLACLMNSMLSD